MPKKRKTAAVKAILKLLDHHSSAVLTLFEPQASPTSRTSRVTFDHHGYICDCPRFAAGGCWHVPVVMDRIEQLARRARAQRRNGRRG